MLFRSNLLEALCPFKNDAQLHASGNVLVLIEEHFLKDLAVLVEHRNEYTRLTSDPITPKPETRFGLISHSIFVATCSRLEFCAEYPGVQDQVVQMAFLACESVGRSMNPIWVLFAICRVRPIAPP